MSYMGTERAHIVLYERALVQVFKVSDSCSTMGGGRFLVTKLSKLIQPIPDSKRKFLRRNLSRKPV